MAWVVGKGEPLTSPIPIPISISGVCKIETRGVKFGYMELERFMRLVSVVALLVILILTIGLLE